jgi:hypothetical protein
VRPPFVPEEFARQSDSKVRVETVAPPSGRPTSPPPPGIPQYAPGSDSGTMPLTAITAASIPVLAMSHEDLEWFDLTPLARSLLRDVNGRDPVESICKRTGTRFENAVVAFRELEREGVVAWR